MSLITFAKGALADFQHTAAVIPSSSQLVRAMVDPLCQKDPAVVIEFGPGTGAMTRQLLKRMPQDAILLAFETNASFVDYLRQTIQDERLHVIASGAETVVAELDRREIKSVDGVVSSLGIGLMDKQTTDAIYSGLLRSLHEGSIITQFQYIMRLRRQHGSVEHFDVGIYLKQYFSSVESSLIWRNIPPAFVLRCCGPKPEKHCQPEDAGNLRYTFTK